MDGQPGETKPRSQFDHDFKRGQLGEKLVTALALQNDIRVETKTQNEAKSYGALFIETEHSPGATGSYIPSGLGVTTADYWAFVVDGFVFWVPTRFIRDIDPFCPRASHDKGSCPTRGFLLRLEDLIDGDHR